MRNLFIKTLLEGFILLVLIGGVILFMAMFTSAAAQTKPFVYTISKDGKVAHKECNSVAYSKEGDAVIFIVSGTAYQVFYKVGSAANGKDIWADGANDKIVTRQIEADGTVVFWKSEKKAFYYKP